METIGDKLKRFLQRISIEAKRTSSLVQAKIELNRLQAELTEKERVLGAKLSQLKKRGAVKDRFILEAMKEEFEALGECEARVEAALSEIQGLAAIGAPGEKLHEASRGIEEDESSPGLDSFEVS